MVFEEDEDREPAVAAVATVVGFVLVLVAVVALVDSGLAGVDGRELVVGEGGAVETGEVVALVPPKMISPGRAAAGLARVLP